MSGGPLAEDLAAAGHCAYALDVRGDGGSTRPPQMSAPPEATPPCVRSRRRATSVAEQPLFGRGSDLEDPKRPTL
ncbi:MAG TPA: hypothetical protein VFS43_41695 [Polyangiaceae bacterium]|nr:hypothetical protein [Polyangiaceae bacterium]